MWARFIVLYLSILSKLPLFTHICCPAPDSSTQATHRPTTLYSLHSRRQTHWLQVIYKSLLGKAPPCLSSLVTIAALTRNTRSSRLISLVTPKANSSFGRLSFQFSAANDWNELQKSLMSRLGLSILCFL
jgi:hypothetical protein